MYRDNEHYKMPNFFIGFRVVLEKDCAALSTHILPRAHGLLRGCCKNTRKRFPFKIEFRINSSILPLLII